MEENNAGIEGREKRAESAERAARKGRRFLRLLLRGALGLAAVCVLTAGCWFVWNRWFSERANPSLEEYPVRGIDISAHNGKIDFSKLREQGIEYVYIKATEGTDFVDRRFDANARGAKKHGLPCGGYHFFRFDTDGEMQALNFLAALKRRDFSLPPAIDVEEWGNPDGHETDLIVERLKKMIEYMELSGERPIIYTNKDGYGRFIKGNFSDYPIWICSFTDPPVEGSQPDIALWQYSHRGSLEGISGSVDLNASPTLPKRR